MRHRSRSWHTEPCGSVYNTRIIGMQGEAEDPKSGHSSRAPRASTRICRTMSISSKLVRRPNETPKGADSNKETDDAGDGVGESHRGHVVRRAHAGSAR